METQRRSTFGDYSPVTSSDSSSRLRQFNDAAKSAGIVIAAAATILSAGYVLATYRQLPARTTQNTQDIAAVKGGLDSLRIDIRDMRTVAQQELCLSIAEKQHSDWRSCFVGIGPITVLSPGKP